MKIALLGNNKQKFHKVFDEDVIKKLSALGELSPVVSEKELEENKEFLKDCVFAFSTWGTPQLSSEQIKKYFPSLEALFYAAGTVQYFARPFLENSVRVFSAAKLNAVPVAEYVFAQISLATKGYFQSAKHYRAMLPVAFFRGNAVQGNFNAKIGLVGLGAIGSMVAEKLKALDVSVFAYDPFISGEKAKELGVTLTDIETLFRECDVISNHLANKKELENFFNYKLFSLMKPNATFINTGRGAQVSEWGLFRALWQKTGRTAVIDVSKNEILPFLSPLWWHPDAVFTPHIAGSTGKEVTRMAYGMIDEMQRYMNEETLLYEVSVQSLDTMA